METLIQENIKPIEKVESSVLLIAATIHDQPAENLLKEEHVHRIKKS
jgi:hypothetical protein